MLPSYNKFDSGHSHIEVLLGASSGTLCGLVAYWGIYYLSQYVNKSLAVLGENILRF